MHQDTRRITVAREHLQNAFQELTRAQAQTENSMIRSAFERALSELDLVTRRLTEELPISAKQPFGPSVESAQRHAQHAWQAIHDGLNDWDHRPSLDSIIRHVTQSIGAVSEAEQLAAEERIHA